MSLVDSHCHLDFPEFEGQLEDVVARAANAGVDYMMTICTRVSKFDQILRVAGRFDNIWCSVGIHPHNADDEPKTSAETLISMAKHPKVVAFGESGLDFYYDHSPRDRQEAAFRQHIHAARETGLPVVIHARDADDDMVRILADEHAKGAFPGVIHCFSSGSKLAETVLEMGLYISVSGIITFKNADELRETVRNVPLERLLVETDAPYLAPVPYRGKLNEPAHAALTAAKVAELKGVVSDTFAAATTENFFRLFSKVSVD